MTTGTRIETKPKTCGRCRGHRILFAHGSVVVCGRCEGTGLAPRPEPRCQYEAFHGLFDFGHSFAIVK